MRRVTLLVALGLAGAVLAYVFVSSLRAPRTVGTPASPVPSRSPSASPSSIPPPVGPASPQLSPSPRASSHASPTSRTSPTARTSPRPVVTGSPAAGHTDPVAVATGFIQADLTWTWSDLPDPNAAARARAAAWSTPTWAAAMSESSSAAYLTQQRVAAHEVDTVAIDSIVEQDPTSATSKTELVLSTVTVSQDNASPVPRSGYLQLTVVLQANGSWAVDNASP